MPTPTKEFEWSGHPKIRVILRSPRNSAIQTRNIRVIRVIRVNP